MDKDPKPFVWTLICNSVNAVKYARDQNVLAKTLSLYRYDSTGRIVHYGPGGDVIEVDSTFQVKEEPIKKLSKAISVSKTRLLPSR
jgi:hypothetical protein